MSQSEIRKAAVLLTSLPEEEAAQLMAKLSPKQVELVSIEIAKIGTLGGEEQESAIKEFAEATPFGFLQKVDGQSLLTFIMDEHPQTIALILSHLQPAQAADIISGLPSDRQVTVIRRIATMGLANPEIIHEVEKGLEHRMSSVMSQQFEKAGGVDIVAEILNVTDRATQRSLLENLAQEDPDLVEEIRRLMFVFEDISKLSSKAV